MDPDDRDDLNPPVRGYDRQAEVDRARDAALREGNPPRTAAGKFLSSRIGSAGGDAKLEPGEGAL